MPTGTIKMCYFIYFKVTAQRKPDEAKALTVAQEAAQHHNLYIRTNHLTLTITNDGHCACDLVREQKKLDDTVIDFVREVSGHTAVKSVEVGYQWSDALPKAALVERLSLATFAGVNDSSGLEEGTWYHVNDLSKYDFNDGAMEKNNGRNTDL